MHPISFNIEKPILSVAEVTRMTRKYQNVWRNSHLILALMPVVLFVVHQYKSHFLVEYQTAFTVMALLVMMVTCVVVFRHYLERKVTSLNTAGKRVFDSKSYVIKNFDKPLDQNSVRYLLSIHEPQIQRYLRVVQEHRPLLYFDHVMVDYHTSNKATLHAI